MKKKVYISGPITSMDINVAKTAFNEAEERYTVCKRTSIMGAIGMTIKKKCKHCRYLTCSVDEITKKILAFCSVKNEHVRKHAKACKDYKL